MKSPPSGGTGPCLTIADAIAANMVPAHAIVIGDATACICVNTLSGHPVVCLKVDKCPPGKLGDDCHEPQPGIDPDLAYDMKGNPTHDPISENWTAGEVADELAGGMLGSLMDCYDQLSKPDQTEVLSRLQLADHDQLVSAIRSNACDMLTAVYNDACPDPREDAPAWQELFTTLRDYCDDFRLEMMQDLLDRCEEEPAPVTPPDPTALPPIPEPVPQPTPVPRSPFVPWTNYIDCHGISHTKYWDHTPSQPEIIEWVRCSSPADCVYHNHPCSS